MRSIKPRDADAASFMQKEQFIETIACAFSFFDVKLSDSLRKFCSKRFESLKHFDLQRMFQLRESVNGYRELQTVFSPFWYPLDPTASEKIVLAIIPDNAPKEMRRF